MSVANELRAFPPFFPPKGEAQALVALSLLPGPELCGAAAAAWGDALGCGRRVPQQPAGRRCSCIGLSGGPRGRC